jgi:hypothetical protein
MALAGFAMVSHAVPITGSISMLGGFTAVDSGWMATSLNLATGLDFDPYGTGGSTSVNSATGDFTTLSPFPVMGTIKDIQFSPLADRSGLGYVTDFWTVGGFAFELTDLTVVFQNSTFIGLTGNGIVTGGGYDATFGSWTLSGQTSSGAGLFSWSSTGAATGTAVPEPSALALLGIGLVGVGVVRFRKV